MNQSERPCCESVFIQVATNSGIWPTPTSYAKVSPDQIIGKVLHVAAEALGISDIKGWEASVNDHVLVWDHTFGKEYLKCDVVIDLHATTGGGGNK